MFFLLPVFFSLQIITFENKWAEKSLHYLSINNKTSATLIEPKQVIRRKHKSKLKYKTKTRNILQVKNLEVPNVTEKSTTSESKKDLEMEEKSPKSIVLLVIG